MRFATMFGCAALAAALALPAVAQQTTLRIFTGGQQRPDVMRKIADEYQKKNPNVKYCLKYKQSKLLYRWKYGKVFFTYSFHHYTI